MTNLPDLPEEYGVHLASMGISINVDPLLPAGTFLINSPHAPTKYFDANTGAELTREEFMAMPCGLDDLEFNPDERLALTIERPT